METRIVQTFPVELVQKILQFVDQTQLPSFALTCRRSQQIAEPLLYESIKLLNCDDITRVCLKTLSIVPRKALFVKSFWVRWSQLFTSMTPPFRLLGNALLAMKSLKLLHLHFEGGGGRRPVMTAMNSFLRCAMA